MRLEARCRQHPFRKIRVERFPRRFFCGLDVLQNIGSGMPFFFQDADYLFSGLNSERTRRQLNRLLEEEYPMEIQMSVVYGYEDLAADATVDLTDFRKRYPLAVTRSFFSQEQQQEIGALEIEGEEPLQMLLNKEVEIAPVELSELVQAVQNRDDTLVLLESSHRLKPAYLMMQKGLYEQLTPKQQAAVEQAVVMACGYCRTVADQNRQEDLEQLRQLGVRMESVNREKYLALLADIYQYDAGNMLYRPDAELDQMVRSDAVKYSVS